MFLHAPKLRKILAAACFGLLIQFLQPNVTFSQYRFLENGSVMASGLETGYLLDTPTRMKIDLSGLWSYSVTNGPQGSVRIPSAYDFAGEVVFERKVELKEEDLDKYQFHLVMLGSNYNTAVSINRDFIVNHIGGYTSFMAPIPSSTLQIGAENIIRITTNNTLDATKTLPLRSQVWGWRNYGGILRDVYILGTPKVFISDVSASSEPKSDFSSVRIRVVTTFESEGRGAADTLLPQLQLFAELHDRQSNTLVATSPSIPVTRLGKDWNPATVEFTVANPRPWSPQTPDRYLLKTYLAEAKTGVKLDEYYMHIGIRKIELLNGRLFLNGKKQDLKGFVWVEDHPSYGSAMTREEMEKDVALIRSAGANAIRFAFHPPHPYMLNLCDRYGLFAFVELPVRNVPAAILSGDYYIELASNAMREMIVRDRNHPSVVAWGLGDDFESPSPVARKFIEQLGNLARRLDARPVYYGTRKNFPDAGSDLVDMIMPAVMTRDAKEFRSELDSLREANPEKPVIVTMGSEVQPKNSNGYSDPLSYEAQARYMFQHIDAVFKSDVAGTFILSFNDWKGDRPALTVNSGDPWMHTLGVVNHARDKRLAYEAVRAAFNNEKFSALPIGHNPSSSPIVYVLAGLVILVGTAYWYNSSRRFRESLNRSIVNSYNFFSDIRDQRIVTVLHSTLLGLVVSAGTAIVLSSLLFYFRHSLVLDNLLSFILISDRVKHEVIELVRQPNKFIVVFTGVFFLHLLVISMLLWMVAPLFKARIYPYHAYAVTMWSTPPLLILVPFGMILFRLMDSPVYVLPSILLAVLLMFWVALRFLKGISIILDVYPLKMYIAALLMVAVLGAGLYFYFDRTESASAYAKYLYNSVASKQR